MSRDDPDMTGPMTAERLICDLTQSWSDVGGGVGTYLRHKRNHILDRTPQRHLLIVPGPARTVPAGPHRVSGQLQSALGRDRPPKAVSRNGARRWLFHRFPDGVR